MKVGDKFDIIREFTDLNGIRVPAGKYTVVAADTQGNWFKIGSKITHIIHEISNFDVNNFTKQPELELAWPEFNKCTCGARITYGVDTILHSYWCDAYKDKYEKSCIDDTN
jgi:hypothetical protein